MRTIYISLFICLLFSVSARAQTPQSYVPFPCKVINQSDMPVPGNINYTIESAACIETEYSAAPNHVNVVGPMKVEMTSGKEIHLQPGFSAGNFALNGHYHGQIEGEQLEVAIYEPLANPGTVPVYEKFELGIKLPENIENLIANFVNEVPNTIQINPYNTDQVDIRADFYYKSGNNWVLQHTGFGFYYQDYYRDTSDADFHNWHWTAVPTAHKFRVRFAPTSVGQWKVKISAVISGLGTLQTGDYEFTCTNSANKGFVKVGSSRRFFVHGRTNETFFPVGQNLIWPECLDCHTDAQGNYVIIDAYDDYTLLPRGFTQYQRELEYYADQGANTFRMLGTPWTTDIEFEKLNDYTDRLHLGWELDEIFEKAKEKNLKILFDFDWNSWYESPAYYGQFFWDWAENPCGNKPNDYGNCYGDIAGVNSPQDFFTNTDAKKHYKMRLRYYVARYGYSTNLIMFQFFSEINNAGFTSGVLPTANGGCELDPNDPGYLPYFNESPFRNSVYLWQNEMAGYIKNIMGVNQHMTGVSYAGRPNYKDNYIPLVPSNDQSFSSSNIDVMAYSYYASSVSRFYDESTADENLISQNNKPLIWSENGCQWKDGVHPEFDAGLCDNNAEWNKAVWSTTFQGLAGTCMYWGYNHAHDLWHHYGTINNFIQGIDFNGDSWFPDKDERKDTLAETFCLVRGDKKEAIGTVINRTYNFFTQGTSSPCTSNYAHEAGYATYINVTPPNGYPTANLSADQLRIPLKPGRYKIEWFNGLNGQQINSTPTIAWSYFGTLVLPYPTLTINNPVITYKIYRANSNFHYYEPSDSINYFETKESVNDYLDNNNVNVSKDPSRFFVTPNPTTGFITTNLSASNIKIVIFNLHGEKIFENTQSGGSSVDVSSFPAGIYFIRCAINDVYYYDKFIKVDD